MSESPSAPDATDEVPPDPFIGRVIGGRFHIEDHLASGGMGSIYRARQEPLGRLVALKLLDTGAGPGAPEFRQRFKLEASACARLTHSNIVRIYDFGITDDHIYYIAMELIEGTSLTHLLRYESPMAPRRALHITRQIVSGLTEAHDNGIIHRDIKPENILITTNGDDPDFVKVVDFGLVKDTGETDSATKTGNIIGSPHYMPPEQIAGLTETDHRSDIYPLGIMLFNMLTGRRPWKRKGTPALLFAHMHDPVPMIADVAPNVRVPRSLEQVMRKCVEKDPGHRFQTMRELGIALRATEADCAAVEAGDMVSATNDFGDLNTAVAPVQKPVVDDTDSTLRQVDTGQLHTSSMVVGGAISAAVTVSIIGGLLLVGGLVMYAMLPANDAGSSLPTTAVVGGEPTDEGAEGPTDEEPPADAADPGGSDEETPAVGTTDASQATPPVKNGSEPGSGSSASPPPQPADTEARPDTTASQPPRSDTEPPPSDTEPAPDSVDPDAVNKAPEKDEQGLIDPFADDF